MSKHETTIIPGEGTFTHEQMQQRALDGNDRSGVVHKNANDGEAVDTMLSLGRQVKAGHISNDEYNKRMMAIIPPAVVSNALPSGVGKVTYAPGVKAQIEDAQVNEFSADMADFREQANRIAQNIQTGRLRSRGPLEHLANRLTDLQIRAQGLGANTQNQGFIDLRDQVNQIIFAGGESLKSRR